MASTRIDPGSARSERRGIKFLALPGSGFEGVVPEFPLAAHGDGFVAENELRAWLEAWRSPQAAAWAREPWRWPVVAEYCRLKAVLQSAVSVNAAGIAQLHRYRDQLGLSPAGLSENGWFVDHEVSIELPVKASRAAKPPLVRQRRMRAPEPG